MSGEIISEYGVLGDDAASESKQKALVDQALELVPFFLKHNAEADACDLLIELELLSKLPALVDKNNYQRVCLYIVGYNIRYSG